MTFEEFTSQLIDLFPGFVFSEDEETGEILIATGLAQNASGNLFWVRE